MQASTIGKPVLPSIQAKKSDSSKQPSYSWSYARHMFTSSIEGSSCSFCMKCDLQRSLAPKAERDFSHGPTSLPCFFSCRSSSAFLSTAWKTRRKETWPHAR
eukprot:768052-Hanusia_phi.AAC.6